MNKYSKTYAKYRSQVDWVRIKSYELSESEFHNYMVNADPNLIVEIIQAGYTPTEESVLHAITSRSYLFTELVDLNFKLSDNVIIEGAKKFPWILRDLQKTENKIPFQAYEEVVRQNWIYLEDMIQYGYNPSEELQIHLIFNDKLTVTSLQDWGVKLYESVQQLVVNNSPNQIFWIKNPYSSVIEIYERKKNRIYDSKNNIYFGKK